MNPEKKLKLVLASLKDKQICKFFEALTSSFPNQLKKTIRQISFNCYEAVCEFRNKIVSGYGKNSNEAYINSIRTLIELFTDDSKMYPILNQSLKLIQQQSGSIYDSQKKLLSIQKANRSSTKIASLNSSVIPEEKKPTLKEQIFEYLNLDNLKISNPNISHKTKAHEKYMNQSLTQQEQICLLQDIHIKNQELEKKVKEAREENEKLRAQLTHSKGWEQNQNPLMKSTIKDMTYSHNNSKPRDIYEPLKPRTIQYLNMSQDSKVLEKSKMRSISMETSQPQSQPQSQTQKYLVSKGGPTEKKITIPKLNLQVLPNYHGKSNKSLNQSLMEVYQKTHK